jgi:hypothetical protein
MSGKINAWITYVDFITEFIVFFAIAMALQP